jgi:hypothetical protein
MKALGGLHTPLAGSTSQTGRSRNDNRSLLRAGKAGSRSYKQLSLQYYFDKQTIL